MITHQDKIAFWRGTRRFNGLTDIAKPTTILVDGTRDSHGSQTLVSNTDEREGEDLTSSDSGSTKKTKASVRKPATTN